MENRRGFYERLGAMQAGGFHLSRSLYAPGNWNDWHAHEAARFVFVLNGSFFEECEAGERNCSPNTAIFRPKGERHREVYGKDVDCLSISLPEDWLADLKQHSVCLDDSMEFNNPALSRLFGRIARELSVPDDLTDLAISSLLNEVAVEMQRDGQRRKTMKRPAWLSRAVDFLHEHFSEKPGLSAVAQAADVHPVHLSRVFKREFGCTVSDYARRLRVCRASELLLDRERSIADIAAEVGFSDQSHFTRVFKQITSQTPNEFRIGRGVSMIQSR